MKHLSNILSKVITPLYIGMGRGVGLLLLFLTSCYNPPQYIILDTAESAADSTSQRLSRPYGIGYNLVVNADSLLLLDERPMHWSEGVTDHTDSLWLRKHNQLVIAAMTTIPEDSVDSVWVKVARDQETMGWLHESDLLHATAPDDPISLFILFFSNGHVLWFLMFMAVAAAVALVHLVRHKRFRMIHLDDIPTIYPTLLTITLTMAAWLYALIQHSAPQMWVAFYFHHLEHLEPVFLGRFLIAAVSVDVAHHIDGHVHLLIDFLLAQFLGKRLCQLVGLDDALHVHQEHDLVAFLSIVAMQVVLFMQVFLQSLDCRKETGTVAIVESVVDRVAQRLEDGVIVIVCHRPTNAACQKHDGCQKERPYCH